MKPNKIIWHHSADSSNAEQVYKINEWHKQRQFPISHLGYFVGYHYFIERTGAVVQCRTDEELGAHDAGENDGSIGICLAGNFDIESPSKEQYAAAGRLVASLLIRWHFGLADIEPHRVGDSTSCPGKNLPDKWLAYATINFQAGYFNKVFLWIGLFLTNTKKSLSSSPEGPHSFL